MTTHATSSKPSSLADAIIRWQSTHGRHDLPWQNTQDPYAVWLSEIMLQQTGVSTVIPYYVRFLTRFPKIEALAAASLDEVLSLWSGLGYYTRARNLHKAAQYIVSQGGHFPQTAQELAELPGIGPSTAAAIAVFCFGASTPILDGNVKRIFARLLCLDTPINTTAGDERLWSMAQEEMPDHNQATYIQGLMDLGATVCKRSRPQCLQCPLHQRCLAHQQNRTADYPKKKSNKTKPTKSNHFALLLSGEHILLCQHPYTLWGGLWVPPIGTADSTYPAAFDTRQPILYTTIQDRIPDRHWQEVHLFTHFRYLMTISLWQLSDTLHRNYQEPGWQWLSIHETSTQHGFPAPVQKWIRQLRDHTPAQAISSQACLF